MWTTHSAASSKGGSTRWQAPELFDVSDEEETVVPNTKESDVYAWSCVCYEVCFSLRRYMFRIVMGKHQIFMGKVPFAHIPHNRGHLVIDQVLKGRRPQRPKVDDLVWSTQGLTDGIWSLMTDCWKQLPSERPTMREIAKQLSNLGVVALPASDSRSNAAVLSPVEFRATMRAVSDVVTIDELQSLLGIHQPTATSKPDIGTPPHKEVSWSQPWRHHLLFRNIDRQNACASFPRVQGYADVRSTTKQYYHYVSPFFSTLAC